MLTHKQLALLNFIKEEIDRNGVSPSFDEMCEALDIHSKSAINRLLDSLESKNIIKRMRGRARALELLKIPEELEKTESKPPFCIAASIDNLDLGLKNTPPQELIPMLGNIAAGTPIEALEQTSDHISVPQELIRGPGKYFALKVQGDSMINIGINNSDIAIIHQQSDANSGDIVVALIDDREASLKRLLKAGTAIALVAENPQYPKRIYRDDQIKIQGKLVGLIRIY